MTPTEKRTVRTAITDYCLRAEAHEAVWHYDQARPFRYGQPETPCKADCSGYIGKIFKWAHEAGVPLADPTGGNYGGFGWTGSLEQWLRAHGSPVTVQGYLVGDIALYGPGGHAHTTDSHTTVCRQAGSGATAVWSSNGTEAAPNHHPLHYRPDLVGVWRHPALL